MKNQRARTPLALVLIALAAGSARAQFAVKRTSDPKLLATSAPVATVLSSPFDDASTRLTDGQSYFYAVFDAAGRPLPISAIRNAVAGCLRLTFDDGNPLSAPVSATRSSVTVDPASVRADGQQAAVATIVPRDAGGVLLGRGLAVTIDASMLWPGRLEAPIEDLGDGSYRARIVSDVPGIGVVDVSVEGVALATTQAVSFIALDPAGSLRDLAILRLVDLTAPESRIGDLVAAAGAGSPQAAQLEEAWADALQALRSLSNGDVSRDDNVLKSPLDAVLRALAPLLDQPGALDPADVRDLMNDLADIARLVAVYHLELASEACGACGGGAPRKVCEAADALAAADALRDAADPDWSAVVDAYARSVEMSLQAEHGC